MPATELAALLAYATAMAFTPGPNTTLSAAMAANHGLAHAMRFVFAVPFGWCLLLLACAAGLGKLVTTAPALGTAVRVAGAAYMLWLAWKLAQRSRAVMHDAASRSALDIGFLARRFQIAGGHIRSIALNAALQAAARRSRPST